MRDQTPVPSPSIERARFFGPELAADPFPMLAKLRSDGPVVRIDAPQRGDIGAAWVIMRFAEAVRVLKDRRFTVDATAVHPGLGPFGQTAEESGEQGNFLRGRTMISVDGADHTRLRSLVSQAFTPRFVERLRPRVQQLADALLDRVQGRGMMDLVDEYASPLPINVISDMLGVPESMRSEIRDWSQSLAGADATSDERRRGRMAAFSKYIAGLVDEKRRNPGDDLIGEMVRAEQAGDRLSEQELLATVGLLVFAGHETTSNLLGIGTLMLLDHPDEMAALRANPELIPAAVEELLRFAGPVLSPAPRFAVEDVEIGGQQIQRGDAVFISLASADRDERQFSDPDDLEIARQLNQHLAFGQGVHYCLGAPLARLEGAIGFATLLRRMPALRLAVPRATISWRGSLILRGLTSLPVAF